MDLVAGAPATDNTRQRGHMGQGCTHVGEQAEAGVERVWSTRRSGAGLRGRTSWGCTRVGARVANGIGRVWGARWRGIRRRGTGRRGVRRRGTKRRGARAGHACVLQMEMPTGREPSFYSERIKF
jgi:hypothetical protein